MQANERRVDAKPVPFFSLSPSLTLKSIKPRAPSLKLSSQYQFPHSSRSTKNPHEPNLPRLCSNEQEKKSLQNRTRRDDPCSMTTLPLLPLFLLPSSSLSLGERCFLICPPTTSTMEQPSFLLSSSLLAASMSSNRSPPAQIETELLLSTFTTFARIIPSTETEEEGIAFGLDDRQQQNE